MKSTLHVLALLALLATPALHACGGAEQPDEPAAHQEGSIEGPLLARYAPVGERTARIMAIVTSERAEDLAEQFKQAVSQDREWFEAYVREHQGKDRLPWHERMGITEEEYGELLAAVEAGPQLEEAGRTPLEGTVTPDGFALDTNGGWAPLDELDLRWALDGTEVSTALGTLSDRTEIHATAEQRATGPWNGVCWKTTPPQTADPEALQSAVFVTLCLGALRDEPQGLLYFSSRGPADPRPLANTDFTLLYPTPTPEG